MRQNRESFSDLVPERVDKPVGTLQAVLRILPLTWFLCSSASRCLGDRTGSGDRKADFSQYMHNLTEKQQLAFSLKFEYELGLAEIASRMGLDRKTAYEHIEAAKRRIDQTRSNEKSKAHRLKGEDE